VTLELPNTSHSFPVFHASEVLPFKENDDTLFPDRALHPPDPVVIDGEEEFFIDKIVDERRHRKVTQYRVRWKGEGPEGDKWLPSEEVENCEALDAWQARKQEHEKPTIKTKTLGKPRKKPALVENLS
jgi:hypothetical protein